MHLSPPSQLLLFVERYVHRGLQHLHDLAAQRVMERPAESTAAPAGTQDYFFSVGTGCYYGDLPLSFAAATGASLWWFLYLVHRLGANVDAKDKAKGNTALHLAVIHCQNERRARRASLWGSRPPGGLGAG